MSFNANIPDSDRKRVVIIGGGFAGLKLAKDLDKHLFQVVLIDKENYHQFQPLLYQAATAGIEPSAISFPFRKDFQRVKSFYFRLATVTKVVSEENYIETTVGNIGYDYLVVAIGTDTNYYGMENIRKNALPMKSVSEALGLRNHILMNMENALTTDYKAGEKPLLDIVIVGAGATGVEISGAISEMNRWVFKKDYPDLDFSHAKIYLLEGSDKVLRNMSEQASAKALEFLQKMGVTVMFQSTVVDYRAGAVVLKDGRSIPTNILIWVSGVIGLSIEGIPQSVYGRGNRIIVDEYNRVSGMENVFAIGDICLQTNDSQFPNGHPQIAQVAIQQGVLLAKNLKKWIMGQPPIPFYYRDKGTMATIGRNKAVVDFKRIHSQGFFAWLLWMFIHLMYILGVKNKVFAFLNWAWSYITYDQSLRLIIRATEKNGKKE